MFFLCCPEVCVLIWFLITCLIRLGVTRINFLHDASSGWLKVVLHAAETENTKSWAEVWWGGAVFLIVLRNPLTSELHDRVRSVRRVRFDWLYFVCACERETERERLRERLRERGLMVTQHNKVCWACMTSFIKLTPGSVSAPLWCDSQGESAKEEKIERRGGKEEEGREKQWRVRRNRTVVAEVGKTRGHVRRSENTNDKQKSWVNKRVSEIANREEGGEIARDKQWQREEERGGPELPHHSNNQ